MESFWENYYYNIAILPVFFYFGVLKRSRYTNANSHLFMHSTS